MKRRSFLAMLGLTPVAAAVAKTAETAFHANEHLSATMLHVETVDEGGWRNAGMFMDAKAGGGTRVLLRADQFVIAPSDVDGYSQIVYEA